MHLRKSWQLPLRLTLRLSGYLNRRTDQGSITTPAQKFGESAAAKLTIPCDRSLPMAALRNDLLSGIPASMEVYPPRRID